LILRVDIGARRRPARSGRPLAATAARARGGGLVGCRLTLAAGLCVAVVAVDHHRLVIVADRGGLLRRRNLLDQLAGQRDLLDGRAGRDVDLDRDHVAVGHPHLEPANLARRVACPREREDERTCEEKCEQDERRREAPLAVAGHRANLRAGPTGLRERSVTPGRRSG
jgi:hypothetical protein